MNHRQGMVALAGVAACSAALAAEPITITVESGKPGRTISPLIYGINHNDFNERPRIPFTRQGGNRMTAYNWENNASNAGADWQHQNDAFMGGGETPGEAVRQFAEPALRMGSTVIVTVPIVDYVAADKNGGGDVNKTPNYLQTRFVANHPRKKAKPVYPPDLTDKAVYQDEFVAWMEKITAPARKPGVDLFYSLDNEPDIWASTHARVHPAKITYAEIVDRTERYASAIKDVNPKALVFGFVSYGYAGLTDLQTAPDAQGRDFIPFFLDSMRRIEQRDGRRLVDVLDLHWYPEARGAKRINENANDPDTVEARVQAPRSLWDTSYTENSWITKDVLKEPIALLPRIQKKIDLHYPGTKLGITEYDYGGGNHISGAVAQADVLGLYGEYGIFAAALWGGGPFIYAGFDCYLNYDGKGGCFGDTVLPASSSDVSKVSVHASSRSSAPGQMVLVLINRSDQAADCTLNLGLRSPVRASLYRVQGTAAAVKPAGSIDLKGQDVVSLPPMSVTTMEITP
jgi:hypothetical protein